MYLFSTGKPRVAGGDGEGDNEEAEDGRSNIICIDE